MRTIARERHGDLVHDPWSEPADRDGAARVLIRGHGIDDRDPRAGSGSESQQIMRDGDALMGNLWHTRSSIVNRETEGRVDYTFNQAILFAGAWIQPKGAPAGKKAWDFAAVAQDPQSQVEIFQLLGSGPINPEAAALVPEKFRRRDAGNPDNLKLQVGADANWYASDYANILNRYLDAIAG